MLVSHRSASQNAENQSQLLDELAHRVEWLCRRCPEDLRGAAAHEELVGCRVCKRLSRHLRASRSEEASSRMSLHGGEFSRYS